MREDLIAAETIKLAMAKNFTETTIEDGDSEIFTVPTQSLLQKWLRESHSLIPFVKPYLAFDNKIKYIGCILIIYKHVSCGYYEWATPFSYYTFEEALEPALVEALNRIQK